MSNDNDNKIHAPSADGIDRRGFLKCMAWAGTGVLWSMHGGIVSSRAFGAPVPTYTESNSFESTSCFRLVTGESYFIVTPMFTM